MAVTDQAIDKLRGMIASGELQPGQRLPREADLAADLGLSRSSLREAVRALSLLRILDVRQGDGTYVSSLSSESLVDTLSFIADFHQDSSVLDLLEVRRILEPAASARAARRAGPDDVERLRAILAGADADSPVEELVAVDVEFHRAVAELAGNPVLASLVESVSSRTHRARTWRGITEEGALARTLAEHAAILGAIAVGDADLARAWAEVHVGGVEAWLRQSL
ncbi:FadR/GntR family transcriptional regulator [Luteimicrobium xylanilyticum]|uniref:Mannosyl-D-glycerate transport/metabolism system repressor MngR n=1 Tax=Luteimicrobium xylanilyticum TaxID=1133546 RepID=A0A5P9Q6V0_9MICO|nr:FadR/GntR family transcriptional regulator [Luteimicrobium xylanilyticum]QFU97138.1 Mannosyl-D-glycerate transport/metabolism system repressor MngR [Luteimicrobium xylanilyticum]